MRLAVPILILSAVLASVARAQEPNPDQLLSAAIDAQQHGDYPTAISDYRKALELRPNMVEAKVNLGAALVHVGDFDGAIAMYKSALPLLIQNNASQKNAVLRNLALAYYKKGDFTNAADQFETLHKSLPNDVGIAVLLGYSDVQLGKADAAVSLLEPLEARNAANLDFEYAYGSALIKAGRRREGAIRIEHVATSSNSADAYLLAGSTFLDLNEYEPARRDLDTALKLDPKLPGVQTLAGTARDKTGAIKEAEEAFREALKINPDDFDANLYLGAILSKRRDLDEARPYLERAVRLNPTSSMAGYEMGMLQSTSGQYQAAADQLEKVVKTDPDWLEPHIELASLYYRLKRPDDGRKERQIVDRLTAAQQQKGPAQP
jgi:tetratricopeptide (TPR) repeat protein